MVYVCTSSSSIEDVINIIKLNHREFNIVSNIEKDNFLKITLIIYNCIKKRELNFSVLLTLYLKFDYELINKSIQYLYKDIRAIDSVEFNNAINILYDINY